LPVTYNDRNNDAHKPSLHHDKEILLKVSKDPTDSSKGDDDPVKEQLCELLAFVIHLCLCVSLLKERERDYVQVDEQ
jgi:hypothetical protein